MKVLVALALSAMLISQAGDPPEKGDYILRRTANNPGYCIYIFKDSRQIYMGYDLNSGRYETTYQGDSAIVDNVFISAESMDFAHMKSLDEDKVIPVDTLNYCVVEYYHNKKLYKVCWLGQDTGRQVDELNGFVYLMNNLW